MSLLSPRQAFFARWFILWSVLVLLALTFGLVTRRASYELEDCLTMWSLTGLFGGALPSGLLALCLHSRDTWRLPKSRPRLVSASSGQEWVLVNSSTRVSD